MAISCPWVPVPPHPQPRDSICVLSPLGLARWCVCLLSRLVSANGGLTQGCRLIDGGTRVCVCVVGPQGPSSQAFLSCWVWVGLVPHHPYEGGHLKQVEPLGGKGLGTW